MSEKLKAPRIAVSVRRDASTITTTEIAAHELPLIRVIHGGENVTVAGDRGEMELEPEQEYDRLCGRYSPDAVEQVFGKAEVFDLAEKLQAAAEKQAKKPAKA